MGWLEGTRLGVRSDYPEWGQAIFLNTATGCFQNACGDAPFPPPNVWQTLDLAPDQIPADTLAVDIRGELIITSGQHSQIPDLAVAFQAVGAVLTPAEYAMQAIAIGANGGARTNASVWVPVVSRQIWWAWLRGDGPLGEWPDKPIATYPLGASYGLNLRVESYLRP